MDATPIPPSIQPPATGKGLSNVRFLVGVIAAVSAVVVLTISSLDDQVYYFTVAEAAERFPDIQDTEFRIKGNVVPASHHRPTAELNENYFALEADGRQIEVRFVGPLPDTFADNAEVIALGSMTSTDRFEAVEVIAKCPSRYEEAAPTAQQARLD